MTKLLWSDLESLMTFDQNMVAFVWKERTPDMFTPEGKKTQQHLCNTWNSRFAGKIVFKSVHREYRYARLFGRKEYLHRACYAYYHGSVPDGMFVRHKSGNTADNSIENLELSNHQKNARRNAIKATNTSGVTGVHWDAGKRLWRAEIGAAGKSKYIGRYAKLEDAMAARKQAEQRLGYDKRHGQAQILINAPLIPSDDRVEPRPKS